MNRRSLAWAILMLALPGFLCGCGDKKSTTGPHDGPDINPADFVAGIDNPYLPLVPGTSFIYEGEGDGVTERVEYQVTRETKRILGVTCIVIHDRVWADGELVEDTLDWFAQHQNGDVWYFGEDSKEIENGVVVSTEGSWEGGVDGAQPGIVMQADPVANESYQQEYYEDEAEDMAQVVRLDASVTVTTGSYAGCLQTKEWTPLEPGVAEFKYYAPGVGLVKEESVSGGAGFLELVEIQHP